MRVRITDIRNHSVQEVELPLASRDMPGWQDGALGWSIGPKGSGAPIQLDQSLGDSRIGVFVFTYHVLLWGHGKEPPEIWSFPQGRINGPLVPFQPERWVQISKEELARVAMGGGDVRVRFDQSPLRFGNYIFESLKTETSQECCGFCNEVLHAYFRVGSQQACPSCTGRFKQEMHTKLAANYRRAVLAGIGASLVGGLIHLVLLAAVDVSFGPIFIGVVVGLAMSVASKASRGLKYRVTGALLTFLAGSLSFWWSQGLMAGVYLVVGALAAWILAAGNAPLTEISGPFQAKEG